MKKAANGVLMRCISIDEGCQILHEIQSGICGNHAGSKTIVGKALSQGFYWPTVVNDAERVVRTCEGCQFFG